jgi:tellurite resistance protein TerC
MHIEAWVGFLLIIAIFLALDLGVFHKKDSTVSAKSALTWTGIWFLVSCSFNVVVYFGYENHWFGLGTDEGSTADGKTAAIQYFTGYVVEQSLSLDNIFVIALVFRFFKVPGAYQHRVLFWGILGAIVLRVSMILAGALLIQRFSWMTYVFGGILVFTAGKMALDKGDEEFDPENSRIVKTIRKFITISPKLDGHNFFTRVDGKRVATPLFLVLLIVEGTDVVFAVDSIPAIFGVTKDPFLVFTSNIFAIMGLRSLYFALASLLDNFAYLKHSLVVVLGFVGVKMIIAGFGIHIPPLISLGVIVGVLAAGVIASIVFKKKGTEEEVPPGSEVAPELADLAKDPAPEAGSDRP